MTRETRAIVSEKERLTKRFTENREAYEFYLKGRYAWGRRSIEDLKKGVEYFRQAIAEDPNYSLAHAAIADCLVLLGLFGADDPREIMPQAKAAALEAINLGISVATNVLTTSAFKMFSARRR